MKNTASPKKSKPNLIVSEGRTWRVEYDRIGKTFLAMINGVGCIGTATKPHEAQTLINEYNFEQLRFDARPISRPPLSH